MISRRLRCQSPIPVRCRPPVVETSTLEDEPDLTSVRDICNYNLRRMLVIQDNILRVEAVLDFVLREPLMAVFLENEPTFRAALREAIAGYLLSPASTDSIRRKSRLVWKAFYRFDEE
jgi:hypothetical protein